jgi:hypothetical protein
MMTAAIFAKRTTATITVVQKAVAGGSQTTTDANAT